MKTEAKRICNELRMLKSCGVAINREVVMQVSLVGSYWYVVFANTNDFEESLSELIYEAE